MEETAAAASAEDIACLKDEYILQQKLIKKDQLRRLRVSARERVLDFICTVCGRGFQDVQSALAHIKTTNHKYNAKEQLVEESMSNLLSAPPSDEQLSAITHLVVKTFQEKSAVAQKQISARFAIAAELQSFIDCCLPPGVRVELHGSSVSGFALTSSNVNINLDIPGADSKLTLIPVVMKKTVEVLVQQCEVYGMVQEDFYSVNKIPRILFKHCKSGLKCEVRAMAHNPMALGPLLQLYGEADQRALQLAVVFKYWASVCRVDRQEEGHYPGHMFVIMVIHFLQHTTPPVLPVPQQLKAEQEKDGSGDHDVERFSKDELKELMDAVCSWKTDNRDTLGQLWYKLLRYYAVELDQRQHAVSIMQQDTLLREGRQWGTARLAVEDPLIRRSNVARGSRSDKAYSYLMSCLKQSLVYFNGGNQVGRDVVKALKQGSETSAETIEFQDSSIVAAATAASVAADGPTATQSPLLSGVLEQQQAAVTSTTSSDDATVRGLREFVDLAIDSLTTNEDRALSSESVHVSDPSASINTGDVLDKEVSTSSATDGAVAAERAESLATTTLPLSFELKTLTYQLYPKVCLKCSKQKHTARECPADDLPTLKDASRCLQGTHAAHLKAIEKIFVEYMRSVMPNSSHLKMRQGICDMILKDIARIYPSARLQLFGSSANGFGSYRSDLDICMTLDELTDDKAVKGEIIEAVADELRKCPDRYRSILPVTSARVPIVKFYLPTRRLECDISLENRLALRNTKLLASYASLDGRVAILGYAVKCFAKVCDMGDASTGSLSSYAYILLLLHYLQRNSPPVVPVLQQLGRGKNSEVMINSWDCYFHEFTTASDLASVWPPYRKNTSNVGMLWLDFLRYCLEFDWEREVICVNTLEPVTKFDKWWIGKHMCIEDPFNLDHNLGAAVGGRMRTYILERFKAAFYYHSANRLQWIDMNMLMDPNVLVGEDRAPKFMICIRCNGRGHKAQFCPNKRTRKEKMKQPSTTVNQPVQHQEREQSSQPVSTPQPQPPRAQQQLTGQAGQAAQHQPTRAQKQHTRRAPQPHPRAQQPHTGQTTQHQPTRAQQQHTRRAPQHQPPRAQQPYAGQAGQAPQPQPPRAQQQHTRRAPQQQPPRAQQQYTGQAGQPQPPRAQQQLTGQALQPQPPRAQQQYTGQALQPQPPRAQQQLTGQALQPQPPRAQQQLIGQALQPQPPRAQQQHTGQALQPQPRRAQQQLIGQALQPQPPRAQCDWVDQRIMSPQQTPMFFGHPHSAVPIPQSRTLLPAPMSITVPSLPNYPTPPSTYSGSQVWNHGLIRASPPMSSAMPVHVPPAHQFQYSGEGPNYGAIPVLPFGSEFANTPGHSVLTDQREHDHPSAYLPNRYQDS